MIEFEGSVRFMSKQIKGFQSKHTQIKGKNCAITIEICNN
jgi:hypothetical protein